MKKEKLKGEQKYAIQKVRNGLWVVLWEDGTKTEHSTEYGAVRYTKLVQCNPANNK